MVRADLRVRELGRVLAVSPGWFRSPGRVLELEYCHRCRSINTLTCPPEGSTAFLAATAAKGTYVNQQLKIWQSLQSAPSLEVAWSPIFFACEIA